MIKAIFYSKFDTQEGPKVVYQFPDGAIVPSHTTSSAQLPLLTFSDIQFFVIPRQELCGNFIGVCCNGYRVLGCPICLTSSSYDRNQFIFNFCIVLSEEEEFESYKNVVLKLADLMCSLEEQNGFLSKDSSTAGRGKIHNLCESLMEDLNNYCECMIPIDELNTLNVKLFPPKAPPVQVKAWHVPLFTIKYEDFTDESRDIAMQKVTPFINGVNSIRRISTYANIDFSLTCRLIRHLVYYGCVFLLDIFAFSAIYAPTAQFGTTIAKDEDMQRECALYVNRRFSQAPNLSPFATSLRKSSSKSGSYREEGSNSTTKSKHHPNNDRNVTTMLPYDEIWPEVGRKAGSRNISDDAEKEIVDGVGLIELYADLRQGKSVKDWYLQHTERLANIDVRRFITFGVIKGFLYRVHKYAFATKEMVPRSFASAHPNRVDPMAAMKTQYSSTFRQRSNSYMMDDEHDENEENVDSEDEIDDNTLAKYLDGTHCFDQICTELELTDPELTKRLERYASEVHIFHR